jgi:hypothetical protein
MADKLTYFDLLMYVVPGALLELALLFAWSLVGLPTPPLFGSGGLLGSIAFLLVAFVLGHLVQAVGHAFLERLLKRTFWGGHHPSEIVFFRGHHLITDLERQAFLGSLTQEGSVDPETAARYEQRLSVGWFRSGHRGLAKADLERAMSVAQLAFNRARRALHGTEAGKPVQVVEAYYQFFRGASVAALGAAGALWLARNAISSGQATSTLPDGPRAAGLMALGALAAAGVFFLRARGAAQNFVREVYRAKDAARGQ